MSNVRLESSLDNLYAVRALSSFFPVLPFDSLSEFCTLFRLSVCQITNRTFFSLKAWSDLIEK